MTEDKLNRALNLKFEIEQMNKFIYAIDKNTIGTLGHTKKCKVKFLRGIFRLWSATNCRETEITVPEEFVTEIGEIAKRERDKLINEYNEL